MDDSTFVELYDSRYAGGYRSHLSGFEFARWSALDHFITRCAKLATAERVLDYGSGSGLHATLWGNVFPRAELNFCDISRRALASLEENFPDYAGRCHLIENGRAALADASFDVVVSVEVMEHVASLDQYLADVHRVLKPGGRFVWTTPCANAFSIEHLFATVTGKVDPTAEGYRRWRWEDPGHLRRLTSREAEIRLRDHHFSDFVFRFRAHVFSFLCTYLPGRRFLPKKDELMKLDYALLRRLPNGASMIGCATKIA